MKLKKRRPFTEEDLISIFSHRTWSELDFTQDLHYWCPLIAAYTGMRGKEISQLLKDDIIFDKDAGWYISINAKDSRKSVKNKSSRRDVPIHPELLSLGFEIFVNSTNTPELFPSS